MIRNSGFVSGDNEYIVAATGGGGDKVLTDAASGADDDEFHICGFLSRFRLTAVVNVQLRFASSLSHCRAEWFCVLCFVAGNDLSGEHIAVFVDPLCE
ncbi:MAG: hypothetical protein NVS4B6_10930 [Mycobacterium sp.]